MKETKTLGIIFISSLSILVISCLILILSLLFKKTSFQSIFVIVIIGFCISFFSLRKFLVESRYEIDEKKQKEKNIRDCYKYQQLLNPPNADMNN